MEPIVLMVLQDSIDMLSVCRETWRKDENVTLRDNHTGIKKVPKDLLHKILENCRGIAQALHNITSGHPLCSTYHLPLYKLH